MGSESATVPGRPLLPVVVVLKQDLAFASPDPVHAVAFWEFAMVHAEVARKEMLRISRLCSMSCMALVRKLEAIPIAAAMILDLQMDNKNGQRDRKRLEKMNNPH